MQIPKGKLKKFEERKKMDCSWGLGGEQGSFRDVKGSSDDQLKTRGHTFSHSSGQQKFVRLTSGHRDMEKQALSDIAGERGLNGKTTLESNLAISRKVTNMSAQKLHPWVHSAPEISAHVP